MTIYWVSIDDSIYWLLTQLVTTSSYNSPTEFHTLNIIVTRAHINSQLLVAVSW